MPRRYQTTATYGTSSVTATAQPTDPPPSADTVGKPAEFARFEDLVGKLVQVPKSEVDEQRQKA
jgi:hypothetical protein